MLIVMKPSATARDIALTMHTHPTLSETVAEAAEAFYGGSAHQLPRKERETVRK